MNKPLSLTINDATEEILDVINKQNLHPLLLLPIIKDIYADVERVANIQTQREKQEYEQYLASLKEKEDKVKNKIKNNVTMEGE